MLTWGSQPQLALLWQLEKWTEGWLLPSTLKGRRGCFLKITNQEKNCYTVFIPDAPLSERPAPPPPKLVTSSCSNYCAIVGEDFVALVKSPIWLNPNSFHNVMSSSFLQDNEEMRNRTYGNNIQVAILLLPEYETATQTINKVQFLGEAGLLVIKQKEASIVDLEDAKISWNLQITDGEIRDVFSTAAELLLPPTISLRCNSPSAALLSSDSYVRLLWLASLYVIIESNNSRRLLATGPWVPKNISSETNEFSKLFVEDVLAVQKLWKSRDDAKSQSWLLLWFKTLAVRCTTTLKVRRSSSATPILAPLRALQFEGDAVSVCAHTMSISPPLVCVANDDGVSVALLLECPLTLTNPKSPLWCHCVRKFPKALAVRFINNEQLLLVTKDKKSLLFEPSLIEESSTICLYPNSSNSNALLEDVWLDNDSSALLLCTKEDLKSVFKRICLPPEESKSALSSFSQKKKEGCQDNLSNHWLYAICKELRKNEKEIRVENQMTKVPQVLQFIEKFANERVAFLNKACDGLIENFSDRKINSESENAHVLSVDVKKYLEQVAAAITERQICISKRTTQVVTMSTLENNQMENLKERLKAVYLNAALWSSSLYLRSLNRVLSANGIEASASSSDKVWMTVYKSARHLGLLDALLFFSSRQQKRSTFVSVASFLGTVGNVHTSASPAALSTECSIAAITQMIKQTRSLLEKIGKVEEEISEELAQLLAVNYS